MTVTSFMVFTVSFAITAHAMCTIKSCINGYCTNNNVCACFNGFTREPNGRCVPFERCSRANCRNGFCSSVTLKCTCNTGYILDHNRNCVRSGDHNSFYYKPVPGCSPATCQNGECDPITQECKCKPGYMKGVNGRCLGFAGCSPATCQNGECDPITQECKCKPGYMKGVNGRCLGFGRCSLTCQNGQCARLLNMQEVCYCNQGFHRDAKNPNKCVSAGGEPEVEQEYEATHITTTPAPSQKHTHRPSHYWRYQHLTSPVPSTPVQVASVQTQASDNSGRYMSRYPDRQTLDALTALENRIMSLYIRLLSVGRLVEVLS